MKHRNFGGCLPAGRDPGARGSLRCMETPPTPQALVERLLREAAVAEVRLWSAAGEVLGWAVSNTMDVALCLTALARAVKACGGVLPEIFNTDQGSQFTSQEWVGALQEKGITISMDGKGRWMDNVFIERLWRSVKYEDIYLRGYASIEELITGLTRWFGDYNHWRPHQIFGGATPATIYAQKPSATEPQPELKTAA